MNRLTAYDPILASLLAVSFFLPLRLQVLLVIPVCLFWSLRDFVSGYRATKNAYATAAMLCSFYLLYLIYLPITPERYLPVLLKQLEYKASIGLLPIATALMSSTTRSVIRRQLIWFVIGCLISCTLGNALYLAQYGLKYAAGEHVHYRLGFEAITGVHPTYMGMYLCFSLAMLFDNESWWRLRGWLQAVIYFLIFSFLFALFPKAPVLALIVVLVHWGWANRSKLTWIIPVFSGLFVSFLLTYLALPFSGQRIAELTILENKESTDFINNSVGMRQLIWKIDWHLIREYWLCGVGPGRIWEVLTQQYFFYSTLLRYPLGVYDTHNQYADALISFGVIGLALLCFILAVLFRRALLNKDRLFLYTLTVIAITFFTENVLSNQHGVVFYAFMLSLFYVNGGGRKNAKT